MKMQAEGEADSARAVFKAVDYLRTEQINPNSCCFQTVT